MKSGNRIVGPSWISLERHDIVAKAPDNTPKEQIPLMLQTLLAERFKLKLHHEQRALPAYALVSGKGRLKLQKVEDGSAEKNSFVDNNGHREAKNLSMAGLAQMSWLMLQVPVLDMTSRQGYYNFPLTIPWKSVAG